MLNATVGVRRMIMRLLPGTERPLSDRTTSARRRGVALAASLHDRLPGVASSTTTPIRRAGAMRAQPGHSARRSWRASSIRPFATLTGILLRERSVGVGVALLVLVASVLSVGAGASSAAGGTGGTFNGDTNRIVIAGLAGGDNGGVGGTDQSGPSSLNMLDQPDPSIDPHGPFNDDGTLVMPVAVDTTVNDGSGKLISYRVKSGDTLTGIAHHFGISMMSIWWANQLSSKDQLHVGQTLVIPPVSGVVVTVKPGDTLDSLAAKYGASPDDIVSYNDLSDRTLVIGQKLIIPDALGKAIPTPKPTPVTSNGGGGGGGGGQIHPPTGTYGGGTFAWPVPGGYISQYFHYSHPAIDIAAPYGSRIVAAASGTVIFAGWKDDMGGYQVWISHGSGLYTAYYHMSAITVNVGERVGRGEQIGRVGTSGVATGPHCHFEVWRGYPWQNGSYRVNPLAYL